ncbi:MAG: transcription termination/antitermination protein NusG [Candidatus Hodarchaeota archaeon]
MTWLSENCWYVVQTKPRNERRAQCHLEGEGIETLNPLMEAHRSRRGRLLKTLKPLFPNYIFARFILERDYPKVRWARGVNQVLGRGREPMPISDVVVREIKSRIDESSVVKRAYDLKPDDTVKIKEGPLKDLIGVFERWMSKEGRIRVLLSLIGYQTSVQLHYSQVEKVWM